MTKLAVFDADGRASGFYDSEIHKDIPEVAVQITDEQWVDLVNGKGFRRRDMAQTGKVVIIDYTPPPPSLEDLQEAALDRMRSFSAGARHAITGGADPYKVAGWPEKAAVARRIQDETATAAEIAAIQQEVDVRGRGETVADLVARILVKADAYRNASAVADGMEDAAERAIMTATVETIDQVMTDLRTAAEARLTEVLTALAAV